MKPHQSQGYYAQWEKIKFHILQPTLRKVVHALPPRLGGILLLLVYYSSIALLKSTIDNNTQGASAAPY